MDQRPNLDQAEQHRDQHPEEQHPEEQHRDRAERPDGPERQDPPLHLDGGGRSAGRSENWWRAALVAEVLLVLAAWELAARSGFIPDNFLPPPTEVAVSFVELFRLPNFWENIRHTLTNLGVGIVIAIVAGTGVGLAVGWFKVLETTVAPLLWVLYVTPKVALAPIIILWLGIGSPSQIALVFLLAVYPLMLNTIDGVKTIDTSLVRAGRVFGARGAGLFAKVILPATLPFVLVVVTNAALRLTDVARKRLAPWHREGPEAE